MSRGARRFAIALAATLAVLGASPTASAQDEGGFDLTLEGEWIVAPDGSPDIAAAEHLIGAYDVPSLSISSSGVSLNGWAWLTDRRDGCIAQTELRLSASSPEAPADPNDAVGIVLSGSASASDLGPHDTCGEPPSGAEPADLAVSLDVTGGVATVTSAIAGAVDYAPNLAPFRSQADAVRAADQFYGFWELSGPAPTGSLLDGATVPPYQWVATSVTDDRARLTSTFLMTAPGDGCEAQVSVEVRATGTLVPIGDGREAALGGVVSQFAGPDDACGVEATDTWVWGTLVDDGDRFLVTDLSADGVGQLAGQIGPMVGYDLPERGEPVLVERAELPAFEPIGDVAPPPTTVPATAAEPTTVPATTAAPAVAAPGSGDGPAAESPVAAGSSPSSRLVGKIWKWMAIGATVLAVLMVGFSVWTARREIRIRPLIEYGRLVVMVSVAALMVLVFRKDMSPLLVGIAAAIGSVIGYLQGQNLDVRVSERGLMARRNTLAVVAFAAGLIVVQIASLAQRQGVITLGVAMTALSAGLLIGTIAGRRGPKAAAMAPTVVLMLVAGGLVGGLAIGAGGAAVGAPAEPLDGTFAGPGGRVFEFDNDPESWFTGWWFDVSIVEQRVAVSGAQAHAEAVIEIGIGDEDCGTRGRVLASATGPVVPDLGPQEVVFIGSLAPFEIFTLCPDTTVEDATFPIVIVIDIGDDEAQVIALSIAGEPEFGPFAVQYLLAGYPMSRTSRAPPDLGAVVPMAFPDAADAAAGETSDDDTSEGDADDETPPDSTSVTASTTSEQADDEQPVDPDLVEVFVDEDATQEERDATLGAIVAMLGTAGLAGVALAEAGAAAADVANMERPERGERTDDQADELVSAWDPTVDNGPDEPPGGFVQVTRAERERLDELTRDGERARTSERLEAERAERQAEIDEHEQRMDAIGEEARADLRRAQLERERAINEAEQEFWNDPVNQVISIFGEAGAGIGRDLADTPEALYEVARRAGQATRDGLDAAHDVLSDPETWQIAGETAAGTFRDAVGLVVGDDTAYDHLHEGSETIGGGLDAVAEVIANDPQGFVETMLAIDRLRGAMDPDRPLADRLSDYGMFATEVMIEWATGSAAAGAAGDALRTAEAVDDARSAARVADAVDDARAAVRAADVGDGLTDAQRAAARLDGAPPRIGDEVFEQRRQAWADLQQTAGRNVDEFEGAVDDLAAARRAGDADEIAAAEERARAAMIRVQSDKRTLQEINLRSEGTRSAFNDMIKGELYDPIDRKVLDEMASRNGFGRMPDEPYMVLDDGTRIFRDDAGNAIHVMSPTNPSGSVKVGADRDLTVRIQRYGDAAHDVHHDELAEVYHGALWDQLGGHPQRYGLPDDPAAVANRLDQAMTSQFHVESYTDLDTILYDPSGALRDPQQIRLAMENKGVHWMQQFGDVPDARLAEDVMAEGMRQMSKQFGNQVSRRFDAMNALRADAGLQPLRMPDRLQESHRILSQVNPKPPARPTLSPVEAERLLHQMGTSPAKFADEMGSFMQMVEQSRRQLP